MKKKKIIVRDVKENRCEDCDNLGNMKFDCQYLHRESGFVVDQYRCTFCDHIQSFTVYGERLSKITYL